MFQIQYPCSVYVCKGGGLLPPGAERLKLPTDVNTNSSPALVLTLEVHLQIPQTYAQTCLFNLLLLMLEHKYPVVEYCKGLQSTSCFMVKYVNRNHYGCTAARRYAFKALCIPSFTRL